MKYRCSPSVHIFGDKIEKIWGIKEWTGWQDPDEDVLFFGMYEIEDYKIFHNAKVKKTIFWCGSDVPRIYMNLERMRIVKEDPSTEHWVETPKLANELAGAGIKANISPSFLENIEDFPLSFNPTGKPHIWLSGHANREEEYGFNLAKRIAIKFPNVTFHLYGVDKNDERNECPKNVIYHGWVSNKQLNEEIKGYQGSIRANMHDGNSEVPIKTMLMGQYAMTYLPYKYSWQYKSDEDLEELVQRLCETKNPNTEARDYWRENLNNYPWVKK